MDAIGRLYETLPLPDKKMIVRTQGEGRAKERNIISITETERESLSFRVRGDKAAQNKQEVSQTGLKN